VSDAEERIWATYVIRVHETDEGWHFTCRPAATRGEWALGPRAYTCKEFAFEAAMLHIIGLEPGRKREREE
jgi:hypothetical protein